MFSDNASINKKQQHREINTVDLEIEATVSSISTSSKTCLRNDTKKMKEIFGSC